MGITQQRLTDTAMSSANNSDGYHLLSLLDQTLHMKVAKVESLSRVWLFATPWIVAHEAPLFMGFSRQEYWSGLPCPSPGDLPEPGIKPESLRSPALAGRFFTTSTIWEAQKPSLSSC